MLTIITTDVIKFMIIVELLNSDPSLKDFILRIHSHEGVKGRVTLLQTPLHPLPLPRRKASCSARSDQRCSRQKSLHDLKQ